MVGERGSTNLEILRTGSGKICRRWLKGVGEMKEICVVSKRGIGMKKKFEFILKFQRVSFFLVYIWKFETLEDWKMIKKKCINSTIWKIWKVLRKLKKLQKERNLKISRILRLRKFKNVCNHIRISTSSPIFTRNNPSTPIEGKKNQLFLYLAPTSIKKWITTFSNLFKRSFPRLEGENRMKNEKRMKIEKR